MNRNAKYALTGVVALATIGAGTGAGIASTAGDESLTGDIYTQAVQAATAEVDGEVIDSEMGDDGAAYEVEVRGADGRVVEVELDESFAVIATESDGDEGDGDDDGDDAGDKALTGDIYTQAVEAATAQVDGEVIDSEMGDDGAAYEVEVRGADGRVVEVELDESFEVIATEIDDDDQ